MRAPPHRTVVAVVAATLVGGLSLYALGQMKPSPKTPEQKRVGKGETTPAAVGAPTGQGEIPFVSPRAHAVETPSAPDAWGGPRTGKEATLSDRVVKYDIDATLDPAKHTVDATEKMTWRNRSDVPVKTIYLHLYLNAFEGPGSTFITEERENGLHFRTDVGTKDGQWGHIELKKVQQNGATVPWSFVHPDGGPDTDHTVVRFDLPEAVPAHGSTTVDIDFHDQLPRVVARTGWWGGFHMVAQWFPKVGVLELAGERGATAPRWNVHEFHLHSEFYADWGEYDVRMTVPKKFQVASAGVEVGAPVEKNGLTTHHFVQGDIHDFAWMAVDDFAPPLTGETEVPGGGHVAVKVFYPAEYVEAAKEALKATIDSIQWFSKTLGPYPYQTSTCIIPPFNAGEAGGMEYQTIFTSFSAPSVAPNTLSEAMIDFVTIHEFGHGFFYGLLASNEFEEPLLDEGLNEYWDMRMIRDRGQRVHVTTPFWKRLGIDPTMTGFEFERAGGALDPHPADPIGQNSWDRLSSESYGQVYSRTATVMHDLEERLGHDVIARAFKDYYAKWHFRHPSTADLREAIAEASGGRRAAVEEVFRQNVYGVEAVDDRVASLSSDEVVPLPGTTYENGKWTEKTKEQVEKEIEKKRKDWHKAHPDAKPADGGPFPFRTSVTLRRDGAQVPETLVVKFEDGSTETARWDDDRLWARFVFTKKVRAKSAELDPERHFLLDDNKLNDGRSLKPDGAAARRWSSDVAALVDVLFSLGGTL